MARFSFSIGATDGAARTGIISMERGDIRTPAFMPVGTAATVKAMRPEEVRASGADIILGNTYHLMLRPGAERVAKLGGLHRFMGWERPILTDSGGYQVMSLSELTKVTEEGVSFASHLDGSRAHADAGAVDRGTAAARQRHRDAVRPAGADDFADRGAARGDGTLDPLGEAQPRGIRSRRRACRALRDLRNPAGGARRDAAAGVGRGLIEIGFDGYAVGGLAVGEGQEAMLGCLDFAVGMLPADRPRYLMGVGKPDDIVEAVVRGIDMFDCVLPTRSGRTGQAFTADGPLNMRNARFAEDREPIEPGCPCPACTTFERAYVHHLVKSGEILGAMLMTQHNLVVLSAIDAGAARGDRGQRLQAFAAEFLGRYRRSLA